MGNPNMRKPLTFNSSIKIHLANKGILSQNVSHFQKINVTTIVIFGQNNTKICYFQNNVCCNSDRK